MILYLLLLILILKVLWNIAAIHDEGIIIDVDVLHCFDVQDSAILVSLISCCSWLLTLCIITSNLLILLLSLILLQLVHMVLSILI